MKEAVAEARDRCAGCRWFVSLPSLTGGALGGGECHRYPPLMVNATRQVWPAVAQGDFCGEWAGPREEPR